VTMVQRGNTDCYALSITSSTSSTNVIAQNDINRCNIMWRWRYWSRMVARRAIFFPLGKTRRYSSRMWTAIVSWHHDTGQ